MKQMKVVHFSTNNGKAIYLNTDRIEYFTPDDRHANLTRIYLVGHDGEEYLLVIGSASSIADQIRQ